jgi:glycosyltransferase 2 family protein
MPSIDPERDTGESLPAPDPGSPPPAGRRSLLLGPRAVLAAKLFISAGLLAFLFAAAGKRAILDALRNAPASLLLAAAAASVLEEGLRAYKQKRILDRLGRRLSLASLAVLNFRTFALSLLLPGELLGGGARVVLMRKYMTLEESLFLVLYDRYTQLGVTLLLGAVLSAVLTRSPGLMAAFGLSTLALAAAPPFFLHAGLAARLERILPKGWAAKAREAFLRLRRHLVWSPENMRILAVSALYQAARALVLWALCFAAGIRVGFPVILLFLSLVILVQHLPISFGGVGLREVTAVGFFGMYGVEAEKALALSLLVYALTLCKAALGGLAGLPGRSDLRSGTGPARPAGRGSV